MYNVGSVQKQMERLGSEGDNTKLTLINGLVLIRTVGKTQKQNIDKGALTPKSFAIIVN